MKTQSFKIFQLRVTHVVLLSHIDQVNIGKLNEHISQL